MAVVAYSFNRESSDASRVAGQRGSRDVWNCSGNGLYVEYGLVLAVESL